MATAVKKNTDSQEIIIKPVKIQKADITIVGDTPLIVHAWSEKAKREMLEAQQKLKKDKKAKEIRLPANEFVSAAYWLTPMPELASRSPPSSSRRLRLATAPASSPTRWA